MSPRSRSSLGLAAVPIRAIMAVSYLPWVAWVNSVTLSAVRKTDPVKLSEFPYGTAWYPVFLAGTLMSSIGCVWYVFGTLVSLSNSVWSDYIFLLVDGALTAGLFYATIIQAKVYPRGIFTCKGSNSSAVLILISNANGGLNQTPPSDICNDVYTSWCLNVSFLVVELLTLLVLFNALGVGFFGFFAKSIKFVYYLFLMPFFLIIHASRKAYSQLRHPRRRGRQPKRKLAKPAKTTNARSRDGPNRGEWVAHSEQTEHKSGVVELQEVRVGSYPGNSLFEKFMQFGDIFWMISCVSHAADIRWLARVSKRLRTTLERYKQDNLIVERNYICNASSQKGTCWGCGISICSGCERCQWLTPSSELLSAMKRLRPICVSCYLSAWARRLVGSSRKSFASTSQHCKCVPEPEEARLCKDCVIDIDYAQAIRETREVQGYEYRRKCHSCNASLWRFRLRWWLCVNCSLEDRSTRL